jgi:hypothetical protein
VFALAPLSVALGSGPAAAHSGPRVPDAAYYRTGFTGIAPQVAGVAARVDPGGEWVELTYSGTGEIIVLGYTREPYLRVTATSVEENLLSQTTYLNKSMFADSVPSGEQAGGGTPSWSPIATTGTARWHDHRIHWMGQNRPAEVSADPVHPHLVSAWTVHALSGTTPFDIYGTLSWIGKPGGGLPAYTWFVVVLGNLPFAVAVVMWRVRQRRRGGGGLAPVAIGHRRAESRQLPRSVE